jgi:2-desacetyl-2-hydroxyethyl bacteriochlorophyllide A dehydrogenase
MQSLNVIFPEPDNVVVCAEEIGALGVDDVLLKTHCSLISTGTESIVLRRNFAPETHWDKWIRYPFYPGYSSVGTILQVGENVRDYQVGQRVATRAEHRQFALVPQNFVYPVPDAVSDESAAWIAFGTIVQHGVRRPKIALGESVVVIGLGILGQIAVQLARVCGAGEVIAIDTSPRRLEMAQAHGATHVLPIGVEEAAARVLEITGGHGAEVVFDVTGHAPVFAHALGLLRRFGRLVVLGDTGNPGAQFLTSDVIGKDLQIMGAHDTNPPGESDDFHRWSRREMIALFFKLIERGQMRVDDLITHTYSPMDAPQAYEMLQTERASAMGVLLDFRQL